MLIGPSLSRLRRSFKPTPRSATALRSPREKQSDRNAKTSKNVDLPLPFGPSSTVSGVTSSNFTSRRTR